MIPISKPLVGEEEKQAIDEVFSSGILAQGEKVEEFENNFAEYVGVDHAVATTNGTQALLIAIHCLGIKGEVIMPSFTFIATATSALATGNKPVFAEVHEDTFNLNVEDVRSKITDKTVAILPVHLYGQCANMDEIMELAEDASIEVIEDAAQAHGAKYNGKKAGSFGSCAAFSFYPTKNMTSGEGGIVTTNNDKLAEQMKLFRNHGQIRRYLHEYEGYNFRMTNLHAAIGVEQLKKLDSFNKTRRDNAAFYDKHLQGVVKPAVMENAFHVYHQYTIKTESRDELVKRLQQNEIGYGIYYPIGVHKQPIIESDVSLPITEKLCEQVISLPVGPHVSKSQLKEVVEVVNNE